ncbi:MAG TPA: non-canonical purine NTP pyrophosphatase [Candidatus Dormibacteraeota bacterium]|nr:non-canonical purine NTP pyrophosphatase [Candidatus Dormibacteraeota bacterium]
MRIYLATGNAGKLREFQALLGNAVELVMPEAYAAPEENQDTYEGNAAIKARALAAQVRARDPEAMVLSDDSGISVDALGGAPGVHSADFGGEALSWSERREALLRALEGMPEELRTARFVDVLYLDRPRAAPLVVRGEVEGIVPLREHGEGGFSFDAVFYYPPLGRTFAELTEEEKNRVSHRGIAVRRLLAMLGSES